jgi:hypothetical protein
MGGRGGWDRRAAAACVVALYAKAPMACAVKNGWAGSICCVEVPVVVVCVGSCGSGGGDGGGGTLKLVYGPGGVTLMVAVVVMLVVGRGGAVVACTVG